MKMYLIKADLNATIIPFDEYVAHLRRKLKRFKDQNRVVKVFHYF